MFGCCGTEELVNHLFLNCNFYMDVWSFILRWLGISTALHLKLPCMLHSLVATIFFERTSTPVFKLLGWRVIGLFGRNTTSRSFQNKELAIVDMVKFYSWWWLKVYKPHTFFNFHA